MARVTGRAAIVAGLGLSAPASPVHAQISPGKLSKAHGSLEGSASCLKCHEESGMPRAKCLNCHDALVERIRAGRGLHARPDYQECSRCHVEHQGVEANLVWWGKAGRDTFDHGQTGFALEGKHATVGCPSCHQAKHVKEPEKLGRQGVALDRTFLGLGSACLACHADQHRAQFKPKACPACHDLNEWKPASRFDHSKTAYPLAGRHAAVACNKCHTAMSTDAGGTFRRYRVPAQECANCHDDPHKGRFGANCGTCHTPGGWKEQKLGAFDHDKTNYPLRGKHAALACDKCHRPGRPLRIAFGACTDCHADAHLGQLAKRADQGRCEACHDVDGFAPAHYSLEDHNRSTFRLEGAHLAVPCNRCHQEVEAAGRRSARFAFAGTRCADCHKDPHQGELDARAGKEGCASCHGIASWHDITFDHGKTRFPLTGAHQRVACEPCHPHVDKGKPTATIRLAGTPLVCVDCHKDIHRGQLKKQGRVATCDACHGTTSWRKTNFDHGRDTDFALDGAHVRLACAQCHVPDKKGGVASVRYKPLTRTCRGCHEDTPPGAGKGDAR